MRRILFSLGLGFMIIFVLFTVYALVDAQAKQVSLRASAVTSGGEVLTGGRYQLKSSIAQLSVQVLTGDGYALNSGLMAMSQSSSQQTSVTPTPNASDTPTPTATSTSTPTRRPILTSTPTSTTSPLLPASDAIVFMPLFHLDPTHTPTPSLTHDPCSIVESEPNNTRSESDARGVLPSCEFIVMRGNFADFELERRGNFYDIFAYQHLITGPISLFLSNVPIGSNYNLLIVDETNDEIAASSSDGNMSEEINLTILPAGRYYVTIENIGANPSGQNQLYSLQIVR